jgi:phage recombination protein Bet
LGTPTYSSEERQLLRDTMARGCTDMEFALFIELAKRKRLSPFDGQIRPVKRWNSDLGREAMVIQVGIDGYRATASRTGELAGIDDAVFDSEGDAHPKWAKVTVYRWSHGEKIPYTATARYSEYVQTKNIKQGGQVVGKEPNAMWTRMPYLMLAKCAEALALRKAFPDELAGLYTDEEMGQADNGTHETHPEQGGGKKAPVAQPGRKSEAVIKEIAGRIETAKLGTGEKKTIWLQVDGHLLTVSEEFIGKDRFDALDRGKYLIAQAKQQKSANVGEFWIIQEIAECSTVHDAPAEEEERAAAEEEEEEGADAPEVDEVGATVYFKADEPPADAPTQADPKVIPDLFAKGAVTTASKVKAPDPAKAGTIGKNRAQRLHALITQNHKKTGFTEEELKKALAKLPRPLEHLSDLPTAMHDAFEAFATGADVSWREW